MSILDMTIPIIEYLTHTLTNKKRILLDGTTGGVNYLQDYLHIQNLQRSAALSLRLCNLQGR
jgi:hypothetical protein